MCAKQSLLHSSLSSRKYPICCQVFHKFVLGLPISHSEDLMGTPPIVLHGEFQQVFCFQTLSDIPVQILYSHSLLLCKGKVVPAWMNTMSWRHIGRVEAYIHATLDLALKESKRSAAQPWGKSSRHPMHRKMSMPQSQFGCYKNTKFLLCIKTSPHHSSFSLQYSHYTITYELTAV